MSADALLKIAGSGLNAQLARMNTIASNLANAPVVAATAEDAYKAKRVVFSSLMIDPNEPETSSIGARRGVYVTDVVDDTSPVPQIHEPGNILANEDGYVFGTNVNEIEEMVEMLDATRAYQNNVSVVSSAQDLLSRTLELLKA